MFFICTKIYDILKQSQHLNRIKTFFQFEMNICRIIVETKIRVIGALLFKTGLDWLHASASSQLWTHPWTYLKLKGEFRLALHPLPPLQKLKFAGCWWSLRCEKFRWIFCYRFWRFGLLYHPSAIFGTGSCSHLLT